MKQKKEEKSKKLQKKKEINDSLVKDRIIRSIQTLFDQEEAKDYYRLKRVSNFSNNNYIEYESTVIEIETYYKMDNLIKFNLT